LDGANIGIHYYMTPDVAKLANGKVWADAAGQIFFSLGPGLGGNLAYASFNKFDHNSFRDALIVAFTNSAFSFIGGFAVFGILGHLAFKTGSSYPSYLSIFHAK